VNEHHDWVQSFDVFGQSELAELEVAGPVGDAMSAAGTSSFSRSVGATDCPSAATGSSRTINPSRRRLTEVISNA
jgi:hypothetical protein